MDHLITYIGKDLWGSSICSNKSIQVRLPRNISNSVLKISSDGDSFWAAVAVFVLNSQINKTNIYLEFPSQDVPRCVHCFSSLPCASFRRAQLCLLYPNSVSYLQATHASPQPRLYKCSSVSLFHVLCLFGHLGGLPLELLQYVNIFLILGCPKPDRVQRCNLTSADEKARINSLLTMFLLVQ